MGLGIVTYYYLAFKSTKHVGCKYTIIPWIRDEISHTWDTMGNRNLQAMTSPSRAARPVVSPRRSSVMGFFGLSRQKQWSTSQMLHGTGNIYLQNYPKCLCHLGTYCIHGAFQQVNHQFQVELFFYLMIFDLYSTPRKTRVEGKNGWSAKSGCWMRN